MQLLTKAYKCDFCSKLYQIERYAIEHEPRCRKNPENHRICHGCNHLTPVTLDYHYDTYIGMDVRKVKAFYCSKIQSHLYPASIEHSQHGPYEFGDIDNQPMRKDCEHFEYKEY